VEPFCQDHTKTATAHDSAAPYRTIIRNRNRLFYLESTTTPCLYVRKLCLVLPQHLQRLYDSAPTLTRALFFAFFLLLRALNSFRVIKRTPLLTIRVPSYYIYFLLYNLRRVAALFATLSLVLRLVINTRECAIISAPFTSFLIALTINISKLSICL